MNLKNLFFHSAFPVFCFTFASQAMSIPEQTPGSHPFSFADKTDWKKIALTELKGKPVSVLSQETEPGISIDPYYDSSNWGNLEAKKHIISRNTSSQHWETIIGLNPEIHPPSLISRLTDDFPELIVRLNIPPYYETQKLKDFFLSIPENKKIQVDGGKESFSHFNQLQSLRKDLTVTLNLDPFCGFLNKGLKPDSAEKLASAFHSIRAKGKDFSFAILNANEAALCGVPDSMQIAIL